MFNIKRLHGHVHVQSYYYKCIFCLFVLFCLWNKTRYYAAPGSCVGRQENHLGVVTHGQTVTHKPRACQRQRHIPRTGESMVLHGIHIYIYIYIYLLPDLAAEKTGESKNWRIWYKTGRLEVLSVHDLLPLPATAGEIMQ